MTFADLNRISSTLSSLNIFSSASKKQAQQQQQQQQQLNISRIAEETNDEVSNSSPGVFKWDKWDWAIVRSRLFPASLLTTTTNKSSCDQLDDDDDDDNNGTSGRGRPRSLNSNKLAPAYLKHGPGYDDFGFVSNSELIKVRNKIVANPDLIVVCVCLCVVVVIFSFLALICAAFWHMLLCFLSLIGFKFTLNFTFFALFFERKRNKFLYY